MGRPNEYHSITVDETFFTQSPTIDFDNISRAVLIIHDGNDRIGFSFNGRDLDGEIIPSDSSLSFEDVQIDKIWFKGDATTITVVAASFTPDAYDSLTGFVLVPNAVNLGSAAIHDMFVDASSNKFPIKGDISNTGIAVIVGAFDPDAYDIATGIVSIPDIVDLSAVVRGNVFIDASAANHIILGNVDNTVGQKKFVISPASTVDLNNGATISSWKHFRIDKGETVSILVGAVINNPNGSALRIYSWF